MAFSAPLAVFFFYVCSVYRKTFLAMRVHIFPYKIIDRKNAEPIQIDFKFRKKEREKEIFKIRRKIFLILNAIIFID